MKIGFDVRYIPHFILALLADYQHKLPVLAGLPFIPHNKELSRIEKYYSVNCTIYHRAFSIARDGLSDLKQHKAGYNHVQAATKQKTELSHGFPFTSDFS